MPNSIQNPFHSLFLSGPCPLPPHCTAPTAPPAPPQNLGLPLPRRSGRSPPSTCTSPMGAHPRSTGCCCAPAPVRSGRPSARRASASLRRPPCTSGSICRPWTSSTSGTAPRTRGTASPRMSPTPTSCCGPTCSGLCSRTRWISSSSAANRPEGPRRLAVPGDEAVRRPRRRGPQKSRKGRTF